ncbi:hypothetical protein K3495_g7773 [Podosphaera aphanis]|nr:hypothetical protein K3495_g7773 [Podosphaera aphanis]
MGFKENKDRNDGSIHTDEGKVSMNATLKKEKRLDLQVALLANLAERNKERDGRLDVRFSESAWCRNISEYIINRRFPEEYQIKSQKAALVRKVTNFSVAENGDSYYELRGVRKKCLVEQEAAVVLCQAHDNGAYFSSAITLKKLKFYHWSKLTTDLKDYILGCLVCAKYVTTICSQLSTRVTVKESMELLGIDFAGPFPFSEGTNEKWMLVAVDYFSRYV